MSRINGLREQLSIWDRGVERNPSCACALRRFSAQCAAVVLCAALWTLGCESRDPALEAQRLAEQGRIDDAIELLREAVEARPGNTPLLLVYGRALFGSGRPSLAVWPLLRAANDPELAPEAGPLLVRALLAGGSPQDAVVAATAVLEREPDNLSVLSMRAQAHLHALDEENALEDIARLFELGYADDPNALGLLRAKLEAELKLERVEEAAGTIDLLRARLSDGDDVPAEYGARLCALDAVFTDERGDPDEAEALHEGCLTTYPSEHIVIQEAVGFYDGQKRFDRGTEILERAAEVAPTDLQISIQLAARLRDLERAEEAEQLLRATAEQLGTPFGWTALADHFIEIEDLRGAAAALEHAVQAQTRVPLDQGGFDAVPDEGLFAYADILIQLGEFDRVRGMMASLEEPAYRHFLEGRIRLEQADFVGAVAAYDAGLRLWPSNPGARYLAGQAAERLGEFDRAISHYREALRSDTSRTPAGLSLARIQLAQGNLGAAYDALAYHLRSHRDDASALRSFADTAGRMGRGDEALAARRRLAALPGQAAVAVADAARERARVADTEAALALIDAAELDLSDPGNTEVLRAWFEITAEIEPSPSALARIDSALTLHPDAAPLHALRGTALRRAGREDEARIALERALAIDPKHLPALREFAALRAAALETNTAVALYDRAARVDPDSPEIAYAAAALLLESGARTEARRRLEALLLAHPWHAESAYQLARRAFERGEMSARTLDFAGRAARFRPGPDGIVLLGRVLLALGENEQAVSVLRHAAELDDAGPTPRYYLGLALAATGDTADARAALRGALGGGEFPEAIAARRALAQLGARDQED